MSFAPAVAPIVSAPSIRVTCIALYDLTKPRLAAMSVLTAMVTYAVTGAVHGPAHAVLTGLGTTLAAGGALSLNQWWERETDAQMRRTAGRPLPRAQLTPALALGWSLLLSVAGVLLLGGAINAASAGLAAATILVYGLIYTPLKRRSRWATEIGAVSGALPALLGSAAAGDLWSRPGLVLTALLIFWQMPHFFAIGWKHREDYRAAGFPLLPAIDPNGRKTASWSFGYTLACGVVAVIPWAIGWFGLVYGGVAIIASLALSRLAWRFVTGRPERDAAARALFLGSLVYLPLMMGALMVDRMVQM